MISFQFETYIADGAEHYSYGADYGKGMVQTSKTVSFPESLLSLVDMNIDEIEPAIRQREWCRTAQADYEQMNCQLLERLQQAEQTLRQPDMSSFRRMEEGLTALEKGLTAPEKAGE